VADAAVGTLPSCKSGRSVPRTLPHATIATQTTHPAILMHTDFARDAVSRHEVERLSQTSTIAVPASAVSEDRRDERRYASLDAWRDGWRGMVTAYRDFHPRGQDDCARDASTPMHQPRCINHDASTPMPQPRCLHLDPIYGTMRLSPMVHRRTETRIGTLSEALWL
jgi:hypothetical protein